MQGQREHIFPLHPLPGGTSCNFHRWTRIRLYDDDRRARSRLGGRLGILLSEILNFIPLVIFIIICFVAKSETQVRLSTISTCDFFTNSVYYCFYFALSQQYLISEIILLRSSWHCSIINRSILFGANACTSWSSQPNVSRTSLFSDDGLILLRYRDNCTTATIHPQEFLCLLHGFTYYLSIPTMYMLLMIYSITNLHVVSWGTREVEQTAAKKR